MALLQINNLCTYFQTHQGILKAVDGVKLTVNENEVLGIVGESGCGKSVLALSILRLLPMPPAFISGGEILFRGRNLIDASHKEMTKIRGNQISMIFQEPMSSLNPVFTIGNQISEVYCVHWGLPYKQAVKKSVEILKKVRMPAPRTRIKEYPYQLSGGMRQRVMIAMALACRPQLLIADEPTTSLDVTIQAQILDLMNHLREELDTAIILISHDLGVIAEIADRIVVMYTGKIIETASTLELFDRPLHPYTQGLINAVPSIEMNFEGKDLYEIHGTVPNPFTLPSGCKFSPRCPFAKQICSEQEPELFEAFPHHWVFCWMADHE